jgi:hypothetical protein
VARRTQLNAGNVMIDVALEGPLPAGALPDLNVEGTIEIERSIICRASGAERWNRIRNAVQVVDGGGRRFAFRWRWAGDREPSRFFVGWPSVTRSFSPTCRRMEASM